MYGLRFDPPRKHRYRPPMRRPLLLNGYSGSVNSLMGASIARTTGRPFIDLTARGGAVSASEQSAGTGGGAEERLLSTALDPWRSGSSPAPVVALQTDTLVVRGRRLAALDEAVVVTLDARDPRLAAPPAFSFGTALLVSNCLRCDRYSSQLM